ncbi:hypothetical protein O181_070698 [Austropuccinia psidii MF-1]|uniref:Uncharacterized protein n=1 Tax=Austropuccinia psidii MF-1 TaxID=1389203 RepID=A0A9Q3F4D6_9BASI|nr:hypothetical protein [Austropuccinia psidii MF-1]
MEREVEIESKEKVEGDQEVETQEPEHRPSIEALSTHDLKMWEEWIDRHLPPSSEHDDYIKNKNPQVNSLSLIPFPEFWRIDDEPESNKSYIWKEDRKSSLYMEEVNEKEKKEDKVIHK